MQNVADFLRKLDMLVGSKYWPGCYGQRGTEVLWGQKSVQSGLVKWYIDNADAKVLGMGKRVADCIGVDKFCRWVQSDGSVPYNKPTDLGTDTHFNLAKTLGLKYGTMDTMPDIPGICLGFPGHFGIYKGSGKSVESRPGYGFVEYDVRNRLHSSHQWEYWYFNPFLDYGMERTNEFMLKRGDNNESVKIWQAFLGVEADGAFGPITETATLNFKISVGLPKDGICDFATVLAAVKQFNTKLKESASKLSVAQTTITTQANAIFLKEELVKTLESKIYAQKSELTRLMELAQKLELDVDELSKQGVFAEETIEVLSAELKTVKEERNNAILEANDLYDKNELLQAEVDRCMELPTVVEKEVIKEVFVATDELPTEQIFAILWKRFKSAFASKAE
jgi:peptidoglycan hydrolase-like protein with peptidoglycan-binding domain